MTGSEFEKIMKENGFSQTTLGQRWGVVRQTIANHCKAEKVDPVYADAIKALAFERQAAKLLDIVKIFND
jgi:DNA-binding XRE family transcriptional regulator